MADSCWVIFPPIPIFPRTWNSASKERFSRDFPWTSPLFSVVSGDRLDDKTTQHWIWIFRASGLFISRESKLNLFETWRKESSRAQGVVLIYKRIRYSLFIESLLLLWISSRFMETRFLDGKQFEAR